MLAKSRSARAENLTRYPTPAPEFFESFPSRPSAAFLDVLNSLPYAISFIGLCRKVQQSLVCGRVLNGGFSLSVDREDDWLFRLFQLL
jgi:hypothetical protein